MLVTTDAQLLRFPASAVRPQGRAAGGMAGIRLAAGAQVLALGVAGSEDDVLVTADGHENLTAAVPKLPDEVELCCTR